MTHLRKISLPKPFLLFPHIIIFLLLIITLFYFYTRGFIPHDEGWVTNPAQRITQGDIPYRDFHYIYLPGVAYVVALGFKLFGVSILVSRLVSMFFALAAIYCLLLISKIISKNTYSYLIPVVTLIAWGPSHLNFAHPTIFAIFGGIVTCLLLYLYRKKPIFLFFAGLTTGLTILFKQNFGVALLINNIIFFYFGKTVKKKTNIFIHVFGIAIFPALLLFYFSLTNTVFAFLHDMYFFMIREIIEKGHQATPFIYHDVWYKEIPKTVFYISPLIISIPAIYLSYKKSKNLLFFASFTAIYYLIGIRPTTDYVHLVALLSLIGIPLLIVLSLAENKYVKVFFLALFFVYFLMGIYSSLFLNYYRWNTPLFYQSVYTSNPRLGVLTDSGTHLVISELDDYFLKHPTKNNYMFIDSFSPSYYLITNKKNPTQYIFFTPELLTNNDEKIMIQEINAKQTSLILTEEGIKQDNSLLARFIKSSYHLGKNANGYLIFVKNKK